MSISEIVAWRTCTPSSGWNPRGRSTDVYGSLSSMPLRWWNIARATATAARRHVAVSEIAKSIGAPERVDAHAVGAGAVDVREVELLDRGAGEIAAPDLAARLPRYVRRSCRRTPTRPISASTTLNVERARTACTSEPSQAETYATLMRHRAGSRPGWRAPRSCGCDGRIERERHRRDDAVGERRPCRSRLAAPRSAAGGTRRACRAQRRQVRDVRAYRSCASRAGPRPVFLPSPKASSSVDVTE